MSIVHEHLPRMAGFRLNYAPPGGREESLDGDALQSLAKLHRQFTPRQQYLMEERQRVLEESQRWEKPAHHYPSESTTENWRIELPDWSQDQRNQICGPADDAELVVKMLNSGAPGVILDLDNSVVNEWRQQRQGVENILEALSGMLTYHDRERDAFAGIEPGTAVIWARPRGLHIAQGGIIGNELISASLFDVASIAFRVDPEQLKHPLAFYIPKSESAEEALWWRDLFQAVAEIRRWPKDYIKCMAMVESHPLAFQMEEFLFNLREHILGLSIGPWDYMASLIHFNLDDPSWVLPDRDTIPHHVPFFQRLRELLPEICHKRGALAVGGVIASDMKNEADCLMDGALTCHPGLNQIALDQFPSPNQIQVRRPGAERYPDLRPAAKRVGRRSVAGTRAAVRAVIRYRDGVLNGKGTSLIEGAPKDLGTDRIYRLMIAQRMKHSGVTAVVDETGAAVRHTPQLIGRLFDEELEGLLENFVSAEAGSAETLREARRIGEAMVTNGEFDPI